MTAPKKVWNLGPPLTVSNSEIQTFKLCRRKWYLTYYRELGLRRSDSEFVGARSLGSRIHLCLDYLYSMELKGESPDPVEFLNILYEEDIALLYAYSRGEEVEALKKEQDLARAMIEGFMMWREEEATDFGMKLVGAEQVVEVASAIEGVKLRGKLDQRWYRDTDGARIFRDWKTVAEFATPMRLLPLDEQMKFYHLLEYLDSMEQTGGEPPWRTDTHMYTMLRKVKRTATAKPPFYMQIENGHNMHELRSMWKRVHKILEEIIDLRVGLMNKGDHQYLAPPTPGRHCTWACDFEAVCSMMDDGSNWEGLLAEYYTHVDPHERYAALDQGKEVTA